MSLSDRLNLIIKEMNITKREFASRVGISENYLYILTSNSRPGTNQNKTKQKPFNLYHIVCTKLIQNESTI